MRATPRVLMLLSSAILAASCSQGPRKDTPQVTTQTGFPTGYQTWKKVSKEPTIRETEGLAWNVFSNDTALQRAGNVFPVGSILVKEERQLAEDPAGQKKPRDVLRVSVMFKLGGSGSASTTWTFKAYDPTSKAEFPRDKVDPDGCYFCHADAKDRDYVFSEVK